MQVEFKIDRKKLAQIKKFPLGKGLGKSLDEKICVMQAVDYVTTGGFSDHPECACPALTSYAIRLNDRANDKQRQLLKPFISKLVGTRDEATSERVKFLVHHSITKVMPILVAATGLKDDAKKLKAFKHGEWNAMKEFCNELKPRLKEAMKARLLGKGYADAYVAYAAADAYAAYAAAAADAYAAADAAYAAADAYADAAYAAAYAADAAYAAAYAAADAYAAYAAADAYAEKRHWRKVEKQIWETAFEGLSKACSIRENKKKSV